MKFWNDTELGVFSASKDIFVSPFYSDGKTFGTPTRISGVVVDGHFYIRPYNGMRSSWYQAAVTQQAGKIRIDGKDYLCTFHSARDAGVNDAVNKMYQSKYASSPYMPHMLLTRADGPVKATVEVLPRDGE
ncbi:DUF2255 family protein [Secundilactobacillus folii]|uniref:DUF2255 family protein n=1 Tax=Secundilactobacillus folii TaxID=2678357 RepID=A0A7X2XUM9_9LACO|nr:DUF2255 family protein [Secundilactobacillus folii]MTV81926.1 DUF2255 family protein [Secundilactobacillus folii]